MATEGQWKEGEEDKLVIFFGKKGHVCSIRHENVIPTDNMRDRHLEQSRSHGQVKNRLELNF
jgi:hypothetical protein